MAKKIQAPVQIEIQDKVKKSFWRQFFLFIATAFFFAVGTMLGVNALILHFYFFNLSYALLFYFIAFLFLGAGLYAKGRLTWKK